LGGDGHAGQTVDETRASCTTTRRRRRWWSHTVTHRTQRIRSCSHHTQSTFHSGFLQWILRCSRFSRFSRGFPRNPSTLNVASALRHATVGAGAETSCMKRRTTSRQTDEPMLGAREHLRHNVFDRVLARARFLRATSCTGLHLDNYLSHNIKV
jgi:hypothetical protein